MQEAKAKLRKLIHNLFTGGMFARYDAETTRRIVMVNILIVVGIVFLLSYSIESYYVGTYQIAILDTLAAVLLLLAGIHVRRTHTYLFASNTSVSVFGLLFLYLAVDGGVDNTGHLWAFAFPLLAVIHFGLRKGTIAIGLFIAGIVFFFVAGFPGAASQYSLDFKFRFVSSLLTISIFAYLHEYIRSAFVKDIVRQNEELARTQRLESLGFLAGGIAHDFNNMLTGVLGNLALLEMSVPRQSSDFRLVTAAQRAADRSIGLAQQLLTFSRGSSPVKEATAVEGLLRETTELFLRGSKVRPEYDFQEGLYPVEIDRGQIAQVIQNVVINGDHAMPEGGLLQISATNVTVPDNDLSMDAGPYVKISIEDEGPGIPEDVIPRIFDLYFTTKTEGNGLGLAVSHSIVSKHDGYITASSRVGAGARFDIHLPASVKQPDRIERAEKAIGKGVGRILLMDDDEIIQDTVGRMLEELGYEVDGVGDGVEALAAYRAAMAVDRAYDVVIMDLTVPGGMGGKEAISRLRRLHPGARVVVSSGYSNDPIMANHKDYGFDAVVQKPVDLGDLAETLRALVPRAAKP